MKKIFTALVVLSILVNIRGHAQISPKENSKYWYYRNRLVDQFLVKGESSACGIPTGYSLPAELSHNRVVFDSNNNPEFNRKFSDATVDLGYYISVLATEYRLLKNSGQPTNATEQELYFALKAYERLDRVAESIVYPSYNPGLFPCDFNGFFIRDDASESFLSNKFKPSDIKHIDSGYDDYKAWQADPNTPNPNGNPDKLIYNSPDQMAALMMGFKMVTKSVEPWMSYNGYNFFNSARQYADKIATYMLNNNWKVPIPQHPNEYASYCGSLEDSQFDSYGFARAAQAITGNNYVTLTAPAIMLGKEMWRGINPVTMGVATNVFNNKDYTRHLIQELAATGNSWECGLIADRKDLFNIPIWYPCPTWTNPFRFCRTNITVSTWCYNVSTSCISIIPINIPTFACAPFPLPDIAINVTGDYLSTMGAWYNTEVMSLANKYLYNEGPIVRPFDLVNYANNLNMLRAAPCDGPHYRPLNNTNDTGAYGWRTGNRWSRTSFNGNGNNDPYPSWMGPVLPGAVAGSGQFNGLDYMLEYNLFQLVYQPFLQNIPYVKETDYVINNNIVNSQFPFNQGNINNVSFYKGFNSIAASNTVITSNANVAFKAGESITIGPGFTVQPGAQFFAYAGSLNCDGFGNYFRENSQQDSLQMLPFAMDTVALNQQHAQEQQNNFDNELNKAMPEIERGQEEMRKLSYVPLDEYLTMCDGNKSAKIAQNFEKSSDKFNLYPNPSTGNFTLNFKIETPQTVSLKLRDVYYNEILVVIDSKYFGIGEYQIPINISKLSAGIYIGTLSLEKESLTKKIIKLNK